MLTQWIVRSVCIGALFSISLAAQFVCLGQELDKATLAQRVMTAHTRYEDALSGVSGYSHMQTNFDHSCTQRFDILGRFVRNINPH